MKKNLEYVMKSLFGKLRIRKKFDGCMLTVFDPDRDALICRKIFLPPPLDVYEKSYLGFEIPSDSSDKNVQSYMTGKKIIVTASEKTDSAAELFHRWEMAAFAVFPLGDKKNRVGTLMVFNFLKDLDSRHLKFVEVKIRKFGGLLQKGLLISREEDEIRIHRKKTERLTSFLTRTNRLYKPEEIYEKILAELMETFGFDAGIFWIRNGRTLVLKSTMTFNPAYKNIVADFRRYCTESTFHIDPPDCVVATVFLNNTHYLVEDALQVLDHVTFEKDRRCLEILETPRTTLHIPIRYRNAPVGVMTLGSLERVIDVSEDDIRMMESICFFMGTTLKNTELYTELDEKRRQIENINAQVFSSMRYAARIQRTLLPAAGDFEERFSDHFIIWMPRDIVGGDFHLLESVRGGRGDRFLTGVIDCTGHGVPGALMTMLAASGLKKIIHDQKCRKPHEILSRLNLMIKESMRFDSAHAEADEGLDASICLVEKKKNGKAAVTFSGARQSLLIIQNEHATIIKGDRTSIGYRRTDPFFEFTSHPIEVEKGMRFYLFSDGYAGQFGEKLDRPMGSRPLIRLLKENSGKPFTEQREILLSFFRDFRGANDIQDDDVTIIGFSLD